MGLYYAVSSWREYTTNTCLTFDAPMNGFDLDQQARYTMATRLPASVYYATDGRHNTRRPKSRRVACPRLFVS